jgi:uncharacterized membrane protein YagU involved in acid resistance
MTRKTKRLLQGTIAGLAGGLAGSVAMTQFQTLWSRLNPPSPGPHDDPATVKAARSLFPVPDDRKNTAGNLVHYSFGTLNGAIYGAAAEKSRATNPAMGLIFGAALFAVADELLVPAMGWSKSPARYPLKTHLYGLASHLVYGATTDLVRRGIRAAL